MATDQRRYHLHLIEFGILNEILNDASSGYQTFVQKQQESQGVLRSGEEDDGDIFPK